VSSPSTVDCIVVGGGPAGTTAATVLAKKGRRVLLVEKESFPRYHIGESLIPYCYFPLERLGMVEKLNASSFVKKHAVQFVSSDGKASQPFYFFKHMDPPASQSWQVTRSTFDLMMLDNAKENGVEVLQPCQVTEFLQEGDTTVGVIARHADDSLHEYRAPITIDATGRDALSMSRNRWRVPDEELKKVALWTYYKGALRDPGMDEGTTTVAYVGGKNWFWYIPLADDLVSVGVVGSKEYLFRNGREAEDIFQAEIKNNAWINQHLATGTPCGDYQFTSDFSYRSKYCASNGLILTGDAFAFLDPVFSSGVFLALMSGENAAHAADRAIEIGDVSAAQFAEYGAKFCKGIEAMRKLVYTFYEDSFSFGQVLKKHPHLQGDLTDCLIGHVERDYDELFAAVAEFAQVPDALPHGRPLTPELS
jgi:flavin-dependent dehydrogenase